MCKNPMPTPDQALEHYQSLVENHADGAIPILLYGNDDVVAPVGIMEVPSGGIQPVLEHLIPQLKAQLGPATWVIFNCESWMRPFKVEEDAPVPGQLSAEKAMGSTDVKECISLVGVSADGTNWGYVRSFERLESGQVIWEDEPHFQTAARNQGGVPDILLRAVR